MADKKMYKVGITVKEPWASDISYEVLDITLYAVENGGDGCSYIAIRANQGVTPGTDDTVWVKATQRGQSIYDLAVKYGDFEGTEAEFEAEYEAALHAAQSAAQSASAIEAQVETNEAARVTAERARSDAETARSSAETARINAENARNDAESLRDTAESDRVRAEAGRVTAEASRVEAETFRQGAEQSRRQQFEALKTDMNTAIDNVDAKAAEIEEDIEGYEANEAARVSAEQSRVSAESSRVSAESARATAETARAAQASSDHTRAETDHGTAASDHTTAQADHNTAVSDHNTAVSDHDNVIDVTQSAISATSGADMAADAANLAAQAATEAAANIKQSDWEEDDTTDLAYIKNKPDDLVHYDEVSPTDPINVPQYATEEEVSQLRSEVSELDDIINGEQPTEYHFGELVNAIIASNGNINANSPRCAYYIPINGGETITGKANSIIAAYYCCVKSVITASGQRADLATGFTGSISVRTNNAFSLVAPADARYLYISHINGSDASIISDPSELIINGWDVVNNEYVGPPINSGLVQRVEDLESPHGLMSLNVCGHNEGHYNYGDTPGLPNENFDNDVMLWKSLLTKTNADFLAVTEHEHILNAIEDGVQNVDSYETLYKQFYPYKYDGGASHQYALFSKYPIISSEMVNYSTDRYFDKHIVNVNGVDICIVIFKGYVGVPGSSGATSRVAEFTELVSLLENEPIVIIPIDTNSQYTEDFNVFRNNGYQLGNFGYWGEKKTCGISESYPQGHYAFDNIIVKGMNINSFDVCNEHATSDHFPTISKLTKFFS